MHSQTHKEGLFLEVFYGSLPKGDTGKTVDQINLWSNFENEKNIYNSFLMSYNNRHR